MNKFMCKSLVPRKVVLFFYKKRLVRTWRIYFPCFSFQNRLKD